MRNGLGTPASLTTTAHFCGTWGNVGDPIAYGRKNINSLTTIGTSRGTRYTGINQYFMVSGLYTAFFDIKVIWNVKGGGQTTFTDQFTLW